MKAEMNNQQVVSEVFETPIIKGIYGYIDISKIPMRIHINSTYLNSRKAVSLVHEMIHLWENLNKYEEMDHLKLHRLSVFITTVVFPALRKYIKEGDEYDTHSTND